MRTVTLAVTATVLLAGCASDGNYQQPSRQWRQYDYNHPDPGYGGYDAGRYYREDSGGLERCMSNNERIYRGLDGRYYCRRSDGSIGLVVGAVAGGLAGQAIDRVNPTAARIAREGVTVSATPSLHLLGPVIFEGQ